MTPKINKRLTVRDSDIPIAAISYNNITMDSIIRLDDISNSIYENSDEYNSVVVLNNKNGVFPLSKYKSTEDFDLEYIVTEKVNDNNSPLFYTYELMFDCIGDVEKDLLEIYINNEIKLNDTEYMLLFSDDLFENGNVTRYGNNTWGKFNLNNTKHRIKILLPEYIHSSSDYYVVRYNKSCYNLTYANHFELIDIKELYTHGNQFEIVTIDGKRCISIKNTIPNNSANLYVKRNPNTKISVTGFTAISDSEFSNPLDLQWKLKINTGSFAMGGNNLKSPIYFSCKSTFDKNSGYRISYIKPKIVGLNILGLPDKFIHIDEANFLYPNYTINTFNHNYNSEQYLNSSDISILINGEYNNDIKITSIDTKNGYIVLNKNINISDNIMLSYSIKQDREVIINNRNFNPLNDVASVLNTVNGDKCLICIRCIPSKSYDSGLLAVSAGYINPFITIVTDNKKTLQHFQICSTSTSVSSDIDGRLLFNPFNGVSYISEYNADNISGNPQYSWFLPIGIISLKELNINDIELYDARRKASVSDESIINYDMNMTNSAIDIGYLDGEPLPHKGVIIIHIPRSKYNSVLDRFKTSGYFSQEEFANSNINIFNVINPDDVLSYDESLNLWSTAQTNHYFKQLINKYIPAGTQFILMDETFKVIDLGE